jgi:hypothetical protein
MKFIFLSNFFEDLCGYIGLLYVQLPFQLKILVFALHNVVVTSKIDDAFSPEMHEE